MLSGGRENSVMLAIPKGRLTEYEGDSVWEFESPRVGEYLAQPEVASTVARSFIEQGSVLIRTNREGEKSFEFSINPSACTHVLGGEAARLLQTANHGSIVKELVGASRFCLEATDIPAMQKWQMQLGLDGISEADQLIQSALDEGRESQMLGGAGDLDIYSRAFVETDDETRRKMFVAAAYLLVGAFSHVANVYVFEQGAVAAVGFAGSSGHKNDSLEMTRQVNLLRPGVYARALEKIAEDGVEAAKLGNELKAQVHLDQIQEIADTTRETFPQLVNEAKNAEGKICLSLAVSNFNAAEKELKRSPDRAMQSFQLGKGRLVRAEWILRGIPDGFKELVAVSKRQEALLDAIQTAANPSRNEHAIAITE